MYLTFFERRLLQDHIEVYKNRREALLLDIDIYKMNIGFMRDAIKHNNYKMYKALKNPVYHSYKRIRITALQVLKYMFVYARLG